MALDLQVVRTALSVVSAFVYIAVGFVVGQREVSREAVAAKRAFQAWWYGLGVLSVFTPLQYAIQLAGFKDWRINLFVLEFLLVAIVVAIGCLVYYLLYVYVGKPWVFWPVATYHLLVLSWLMYLVTLGGPFDYGPHCPDSGFCYKQPFAGTPASTWLGISLIGPILLAALAYFALYFRVDAPIQKYRIGLVAGALIVWFGTSLSASFIHGDFPTASGETKYVLLSAWKYWTIVSNLVGLCASIVIFMAYRPPRAILRSLQQREGQY